MLSTVSTAKIFLGKYQVYAGDSFYGSLAKTLNGFTDNINITLTSEDVTLKALVCGQGTADYAWTYTDANGIKAQSKDVVLSYYEGRLNCFLNNWPLYHVIDVPTVSREQAIQIALAAAQNYTYKISNGNVTSTVSVAGFKVAPASLSDVTLSYVNCPNSSLARDSNPFALYPSWYVPLGFDKFYPTDVSGISVAVWADNGKIGSIGLMSADSSANVTQVTTQGFNSTLLSVPIAIGAIILIGALFVSKRRVSKLAGGKKIFNPAIWAILLCMVITFSAASTTVQADSVFPHDSGEAYGALNGTPGYPPGSPPQLPQEQTAAYWVGSQIASDLAGQGFWYASNLVGTATTKTE